ncbi:nitrogen permease regulator 3, partial [Tremellales sp. Uapishka_1]
MAENILGLLFVTSSSRGRSIFRYPPDPTSPLVRLTQPIYPSATYTARDSTVDTSTKRERLFPSRPEGRRSLASSEYVSRVRREGTLGSSDWGSRVNLNGLAPRTQNGESGSEGYEDEDSESSSDDSDYDGIWEALGATNASGRRHGNGSDAAETDASPKNSTLKIPGEMSFDEGRRPSIATGTGTLTGEDQKPTRDTFIASQYTSALGYSLDFLSDMLTPPRAACNRKFEVCVDELVFVGHPMSVNPDGKWELPTDIDDEDDNDHDPRRVFRGRKMRDGVGNLGTLVEGAVVEPAPEATPKPVVNGGKEKESSPIPTLNMFHLVLVLDKPDPKSGNLVPEGPGHEGLYDEVYREIALKWTAAAYALQVRENWVAKEAWELAKIRERDIAAGVPVMQCLENVVAVSSLAKSLFALFNMIWELKSAPINPLYSHLPMTTSIQVSDIPVSMVISPRSTDNHESWNSWGEIEEGSEDSDESISDDDSVSHTKRAKLVDLRVEPWQTLLLIEDDPSKLLGLGVTPAESTTTPSSPGSATERRNSRSTWTGDEEDEGALEKALITACDVSKPLADIAHLLRFDLEGVVLPLARQLVESKRAILIDVINSRLRGVVMPTTIKEHTITIHDYALVFNSLFPDFPPLPAFISIISSSSVPFRDHFSREAMADLSKREIYMNALIWLLKHDLVVQVHTRARIFARPEIKQAAWRKLWFRRRGRWLDQKRRAELEALDLVTPRASDAALNPLEKEMSVPPPANGVESTPMGFTAYDSDLEMDSDLGEDSEAPTPSSEMEFSEDVKEPERTPSFMGSFIFKPAKAQKEEARWIRVIREAGGDIWASKFDLCVQYLDGVTTFEEITYRTGLQRRELDKILQLYKDDLVTFLHP